MTESLDPIDVAVGYLARRDYRSGRGPKPGLSFSPLSVWEDWIDTEPEKAWLVFLEIVRRRPSDDEVLEQLTHRLEFLLQRHWASFHERVSNLVSSNDRLKRIVPREVLQRSYYEPKYKSFSELAAIWVKNSQSRLAHQVRHLIDEDPQRAVVLALELIHRAPFHGFTSYDVMSPLLELLQRHGPLVIDGIEVAAAESVAVRRVLWRMSPQQGSPPTEHDVAPSVWERVVAAAADTTDYNTDDPVGVRSPLPEELEQIVAAWYIHEETFWAWEEVNEIVERNVDEGWELVCCLVAATTDHEVLGTIGAGPLEDLIRKYGAAVVDRVEAEARRNSDFRYTLGAVWLSLDDLSDELTDRFYWSSDGVLQILERHDEPWRSHGA